MTAVVTALRAFSAIAKLEQDKAEVEKIAKQNAELYQQKKEYADIIEAIANILAPIGFEIIEASNGQEGLEKLTTVRPDLIVTNLMMPVMNGFEMTERLRSLPEFTDAIVIASSASVYEVARQRSRDSGCNDFLAKPIELEDLFGKLQNYLQLEWIAEHTDELVTENEQDLRISPPDPPKKGGEKTYSPLLWGVRGAKSVFLRKSCEEKFSLIAPPTSALIALYNAAEIGDITSVEVEANNMALPYLLCYLSRGALVQRGACAEGRLCACAEERRNKNVIC